MSERLPCQVCGRVLAVKNDGTSRHHFPTARSYARYRYDRDYCQGSGYRLARWDVGQEVRHHSGDRWLIVEDRGGEYGSYFIRCLAGREEGREMVAHGEYMHRHGWTPLPPDLMKALEASLSSVDRPNPSSSGPSDHAVRNVSIEEGPS